MNYTAWTRTSLPPGFRKEDYIDGLYYDMSKYANFWTSSSDNDYKAYHMTMRFDSKKISMILDPVEYALSVRCLKN